MTKDQPAFTQSVIIGQLISDGPLQIESYGPGGMSLKAYAAIKLKVPDSGDECLDEMIRKANRKELAAKAMQGMMADPKTSNNAMMIAEDAFKMADAMIAFEEKEGESNGGS